jgi:hypothetical protein
MNLANAVPQNDLSSTGYCLAQTSKTSAEYLVYAPSGGQFTVDISAMGAKRKLAVEWFNPATGETVKQNEISAGSNLQNFKSPFDGDAVLYLVETKGYL